VPFFTNFCVVICVRKYTFVEVTFRKVADNNMATTRIYGDFNLWFVIIFHVKSFAVICCNRMY
jgi:hypothetical protein